MSQTGHVTEDRKRSDHRKWRHGDIGSPYRTVCKTGGKPKLRIRAAIEDICESENKLSAPAASSAFPSPFNNSMYQRCRR